MEKITTEDGSVTYRNDKYGDIYHSKSGAVTEAIEKYVKPCKIAELAKKGHLRLLDVCFGLGYNSAAAIDVALVSNPDCDIVIIGLENDKHILTMTKAVAPELKSYAMIQEASKCLIYDHENVKINLMLGDARVMINSIEPGFDAVFFDPFSPAKQPDLWTAEFMKDVYETMNSGAILSTYSYARMVRDNLKEAGFIVKDGPIIGRRSPSSLAVRP